ncbi:MAG: hypothetical protein V1746_03760 [bacterium]
MNSILHKTEAVFAAYLRSFQTTPELLSCVILEGLEAGNVTLPCIVCAANNPKELVPGCFVFEVELIVHLETQTDDETLRVHQSRVSFIQDKLADDENAKAFINKPPVGDDKRLVQGYLLSGYYLTDISASEQDRHAVTELKYLVTACPEDG